MNVGASVEEEVRHLEPARLDRDLERRLPVVLLRWRLRHSVYELRIAIQARRDRDEITSTDLGEQRLHAATLPGAGHPTSDRSGEPLPGVVPILASGPTTTTRLR